jgi:hypothetical protein
MIRMDVRTGGEGRRKAVTRNSMMALKVLMNGWMSRQPDPLLGERVYNPGKVGRNGTERIPLDTLPSRLKVEAGKGE